jgi:hypothetical protein
MGTASEVTPMSNTAIRDPRSDHLTERLLKE